MKYNASNRFAEARLVRELTTAAGSILPPGFNGSLLIDTVIDFTKKFPQMKFIDPKLLADAIVVDARTLPSIPIINNMIGEFYLMKLTPNLNNIYANAPAFFEKNFIRDPMGFELYQKYYYLICFIKFVAEKLTDDQFQANYKMTDINAWVNSRRDPNIDYIIVGPTENTVFDINFEQHYSALISSSTSMADIVRYQQLTTAQTTSDDVLNILSFLQRNPNTYFKNPDEAKKYTLNIDSSRDVIIGIDKDNNLLFDCGYVNFGDTTESNDAGRLDEIQNLNPTADMDSRIATKKIERIFQMYSRVKVLECVVAPDAFITSLDIFPKVFIVFQGVLCSERNIYNTIENNYFKIGGCFKRTNRGYEFQQDVNAITYKTAKTRVSGFKIFISLDPNARNVIMPNEFPLKFTKFNVYQHPYTVNEGVNMKRLHMVRIPSPDNGTVTDHKVKSAVFNPTRKTTPQQRWQLINNPPNNNSVTESNVTHDIAYINTDTGTINDKFFRVGEHGDIRFTDENNQPYTFPDKNWIKYNDERNDICLINLLKYDGKIKHIAFGSYLYSDSLKTIQNLDHVTEAWHLSNLNFRYDTTFKLMYGNDQISVVPFWDPNDGAQPTEVLTWEQVKLQALKGELFNIDYYKLDDGNNPKYFAVSRELNYIKEYKATDQIKINGVEQLFQTLFQNAVPFIEYNRPDPNQIINQGAGAGAGVVMTKYVVYKLSHFNPTTKSKNLKAYYKYYQLTDYYMYNTTKWNIKAYEYDGKLMTIVKDSAGNMITGIRSPIDINVRVSHLNFTNLNDLTLTNYVYYDASNNKITITWCRFRPKNTTDDLLIIITETFVVVNNSSEFESIVFDMNTTDVKFSSTKAVAYVVYVNVVNALFDDEGFITNLKVADLELRNMTAVVTSTIVQDPDTGLDKVSTDINKNELLKYNMYVDDYDPHLSNAFKAYRVGTFDPVAKYWSDSIYTNSILHCALPTKHTYMPIKFRSKTVNGLEEGVVLYQLDTQGQMHIRTGSYIINTNGLFEVMKTGTKKLKAGESLFVSRKQIKTYYYIPADGDDLVIPTDGTVKSFNIRDQDDILKPRYIVMTSGDALGLNTVMAFEQNQLLNNAGEPSDILIPIGTYSGGVTNNIPIYIDGLEIVINTNRGVKYEIQTISLSKVIDETHEYRLIDNVMVQRWIDTIIYSNKCERTLERELFQVSIPETIYAMHPFIRFLENSFVLPKRVNEHGEYITIVNKTNQNITTGSINMVSNYETTKSNTGTDLRIGNRIGPLEEYIIESMDPQMLLIGNMFKQGTTDDIAIRKDEIYVVPKASKLNLTLEFT